MKGSTQMNNLNPNALDLIFGYHNPYHSHYDIVLTEMLILFKVRDIMDCILEIRILYDDNDNLDNTFPKESMKDFLNNIINYM